MFIFRDAQDGTIFAVTKGFGVGVDGPFDMDGYYAVTIITSELSYRPPTVHKAASKEEGIKWINEVLLPAIAGKELDWSNDLTDI